MARMTPVQKRAHADLAVAEKRLIQAYYFESDPEKIERLERNVKRRTQVWRKCAPASVIHPARRPNVGAI